MVEFQRLRQGSMTVDQYETKFAELSQYAPELVENPINRGRRFRDGLRPELRSPLILLNLRNYNDLYERAQMIERVQNDRAASSGSRFSSHRDNICQGKRPMFGNRFQGLPRKKGGFNRSRPIRNDVCRFYGRRHRIAPCPARTVVYFECGQQGHIARNCPMKQRGQPQLPPPPPMRQIGGYAP